MSLMSMTGYGRAEADYEDWSWVWEVRAVNGKNLDMRLRLPPGFESLEPLIRRQANKALARGNLQINLTIQADGGAENYVINTDWLQTLISSATDMGKKNDGISAPRIDSFYLVKGVITETADNASDPKHKPRNDMVLKSLGDMLVNLNAARKAEGKAMGKILKENIKNFDKLLQQARACDSVLTVNIKAKFEQKLTELLGENLPQDKLVQEAALLAIKADIREELDRLSAHVDQAETLLKTGSPVGRKLDFLSQEFIREINTLCAKSTDIDLTQIGLEMKSLIEQFREQAANVE